MTDAARRQREYRERRQAGFRVVPVLVSDEMINGWIEAGLLVDGDREMVAEIVDIAPALRFSAA